MTIADLASILRASESADAERPAAIDRLVAAATACGFDEIERELPAKARYIGPGPWLDTIRDLAEDVQEED